MTRAVIYARVSTSKESQTTSIPGQLSACWPFVQRMGWKVVAGNDAGAHWSLPGIVAFWDVRSASKQHDLRDGWQQILDLCQSGQVDKIVVDKRDRLLRDFDEFRAFKKRFMQDYAVEIVPVMGIRVDPLNPFTEDAEEQEFLEAERFSRRLARITSAGMQRRIEAGFWPSFPPFGSKKGEVKGVPVWDEEARPALLHIFKMWADGASDAQVRHWLMANAAAAPRGGGWSNTTVARIRGNPFYIGEYWRAGQVYQLRHEVRIDRELWEGAQGEIAPGKRGRPNNGEYIYLLPRVVCSHYRITHPSRRAGEPLPLYARWSMGRGGVRYPWYRRADNLAATAGVTSERIADGAEDELRPNVDARMLDRAVVEMLIEMSENQDWLMLQLTSSVETNRQSLQSKHEAMTKQRTRAGRELLKLENNVVKLVSDGTLGEALKVVNHRIKELRNEIESLDSQLAKVNADLARLEQWQPRARNAAQRINAVKLLWEKGAWEDLRELLAMILDYVDVRLDQPRVYLNTLMFLDRHNVPLAALTGLEPVFSP